MKHITKFTLLYVVSTTCFITTFLLFPTWTCSETQAQSHFETKNGIYIPKNLKETFVELKKMLPSDELKEFKETPENEIYKFHFSVGLGLRNRWGLWGESPLKDFFSSIGIFHPDDMSGIIFKSFWRHLNNNPIQLEELVNYYQEYWKYHIPAEDAVSPTDEAEINFISAQQCNDLTISEHCLVHFGVSKSDGTPWAYQYGIGVYEPTEKDKKEILKHAQKLKIK